MSNREKLRSLTLGKPARELRRKLVQLRDPSGKRRLEVEFDEEGKPKMEPVLDKKKKPVFDDQGQQVMKEKSRYRYPPLLNDDGSPVQVEVREPGLKQRSAIFRAAGVGQGEEATVDMAALQVETVIALTYEPGTNIKVYGDVDRQSLMAQPSGGFVDDIFVEAYPLMNTDAEEKIEKN